jgi:hypothetical protein
MPYSTGSLDDWSRNGTPATKPMATSNGPKRLSGLRRIQYRPTSTGPRMMSAFCAASQPG